MAGTFELTSPKTTVLPLGTQRSGSTSPIVRRHTREGTCPLPAFRTIFLQLRRTRPAHTNDCDCSRDKDESPASLRDVAPLGSTHYRPSPLHQARRQGRV